MRTRIIAAAVILPVGLAIIFFCPPIVMTVAVALISAVAAYELFDAVNRTCAKTPSPRAAIYAIIAAVMVPFVVHLNSLFGFMMFAGELVVFFVLLSLVLIDFFLTLKSEKRLRLRQLLITPVAAFVIPYMLSAFVGLKMLPEGHLFVMLPVVAAVVTDSGAYFSGIVFGKHKPFPKISPNKTVEGFVGGIVLGIAGMLIYGLILNAATLHSVYFPALLVYGFAGAVITEIGDLAFSLIKRKCGIKDFGSLIPGHGGILDRFDSMIFCAPLMYALVIALPAVAIRS